MTDLTGLPQENTQFNDLASQLVVMHKSMIDKFLSTSNFAEVIGLYSFYYYTAKWQGTNQPKCTTKYTATGMKWGVEKVRKYKKALMNMGLIQDIIDIDPKTKKAKGWYIKINYIFKQETIKQQRISHTTDLPGGGLPQGVGKSDPNALSSNTLNALSTDIKTVYDYWNTKKLIKHNKLSKTLSKGIKQGLKDYSVDDIKKAINNYERVLLDDKHFWTHKWTVGELCARGLDRFTNDELCKPNQPAPKKSKLNGNQY